MTNHHHGQPDALPDSLELNELRQLVAAIRQGRVDGFVVDTDGAESVYTLTGADRPYRLFLETMGEGAATVSADGTVLFANSRLSTMLGTPLHQLVGSDLYDFCTPSTRSQLVSVVATPDQDQARIELLPLTGEPVPALVSAGRLDLDGQAASCLVIADLRRHEQAIEQLHFQARLLDAAGDAIIATDASGIVTYVNAAAERLYGWNRTEMLHKPVVDFTGGPDDADQAATIVERLGQGQPWTGEFVVRRRDGSRFPANVTATPLTGPDGTVTGIIGMSHDISARRHAEERLEASERWFRTIVASSSDLIAVLGADARLIYGSPSARDVLGWDPDARAGDSMLELVHPDDLALVVAAFAEVVRHPGAAAPLRWRCLAAGDQWRTLETIATNCLDDPAIAGVVVNGRDVTDAERLQVALESSEGLLREAQRISHTGHWQWHVAENRLEWLAEEVFAIHGLTEDQWGATLGDYLQLVHPDDRERFLVATDDALVQGHAEVEHRIVRPDGATRHVRNRGVLAQNPAGDPLRLVGTCQDVTDAVEAREALKERVKELTCLSRISTAAHQLDDPLQLQATTVEALSHGMQYPTGAVAFVDFDRRRTGVPPVLGQAAIEAPIVVAGRSRGNLAVAYRDPTLAFLPEERSLIRAVADTIALWLERHDAATGLSRSETRYRHLADNAPEGIYLLTLQPQLELTYHNPALSSILGVQTPDATEMLAVIQRVRTTGQADATTRVSEEIATRPLQCISADGVIRWIEIRETRIDHDNDPDVFAVQGLVLDVTAAENERAALELVVRREQEAVKQLQHVDEIKNAFLQAVSHELRTPLTSILGLSMTLHEHADELDQARGNQLLEGVIRNAERLRHLIEDLLDINRLSAGKVEPQRQSVAMDDLIQDAAAGLDLGGRLTLQLHAPTVNADPNQLGRIVHNLLLNITRHTPPNTHIWVSTVEDNDGWTITVEDDGPGVPDEMKAAIFEPFTQGPQSHHSAQPGTGIGLHLVARFAAMHHGRAWVTDRSHGGSSFHVRIGRPMPSGRVPRPDAAIAGIDGP